MESLLKWAVRGALVVLLFLGTGCYGHYGGGGYAAGVVISSLPYGYYDFYFGGARYYYSDGYYYRPHRRGYVRVGPPRGAIIPRLPARARRYRQGRTEYKEYRGVRYERVRDGKKRGYRIRGRARRR